MHSRVTRFVLHCHLQPWPHPLTSPLLSLYLCFQLLEAQLGVNKTESVTASMESRVSDIETKVYYLVIVIGMP